jgi:hypothetical protein
MTGSKHGTRRGTTKMSRCVSAGNQAPRDHPLCDVQRIPTAGNPAAAVEESPFFSPNREIAGRSKRDPAHLIVIGGQQARRRVAHR